MSWWGASASARDASCRWPGQARARGDSGGGRGRGRGASKGRSRRMGGVLEEAKMTKVRPRQGLSCLGCNRASNCNSRAHESVNKTVVIWKRRNRDFLVQCGRNSFKCIPKGVDGIPFYSVLVRFLILKRVLLRSCCGTWRTLNFSGLPSPAGCDVDSEQYSLAGSGRRTGYYRQLELEVR